MKIKICGITSVVEAEYLNSANADFAGFVFYKKSKRDISVEKAKEIIKELNPRIKKVAVMVSPTKEEFIEKQDAGFDIVQVHGELIEEILDITKVPIWLAINFSDEEFKKKTDWLKALTDSQYEKIKGIVVDSKNFGSGTTFDWEKNKEKLETKALKDKDFILAGGLNASNVSKAIKILKPDIVDVSSGVEKSKEQIGKDKKLIDDFIKEARKEAL